MRARMGNEENDDDRQSRRGIYSTIGKNGDDKCGPRIVYMYIYIYEYTILFIKRGMQKGSFGSLYNVCGIHILSALIGRHRIFPVN